MDHFANWVFSFLPRLQTTMDYVINRGSHFLLRASQSTMNHFINWVPSFLHSLQTIMDYAINRASHFLLRASILLESHSTMDHFINWVSSFLPSLQTNMDCVIKWLVSLISCLGPRINPILEKFTGHTFAGAVVVAVAAIVLVWFLSMRIPVVFCFVWKMIKVIVWFLWKMIKVVVCFPWKMIKVIVPFVWKMIKVILRCCYRTGKTMKAPGRSYRILRATFEHNPAAYFRNLRRGL